MSLLETIGKIVLDAGVAVAAAGPVVLVLGWGLEAGIRFVWGGALYPVAGLILLPRLYEPISLSGFDSRPGRAPWLSFILVVFGTAVLP
ncbi:MAG: hypothetical protein ABEH58_01400 [Haloplanus sp.]